MAATPYTRLTGNVSHVGTYSSLWLGPDHVMLVRSSGYHETYTRLQFTDIRGLFLTASPRRMWWAYAWGIVAVLAGLFMTFAWSNHRTPYVSPVFFGVAVMVLIWNQLLGPGCRAYVLTGVQAAELPSLIRMPKARRVITKLEPLISAAQRDFMPPVPSLPAVGMSADTAAPANPAPTAAPAASETPPANPAQPGEP